MTFELVHHAGPRRRTVARYSFVNLVLIVFATVALAAQRSAAPTDLPPDKIFAAVGVREGMTIGEIGAGDGALSIAVAKLVGTTGKVYTSELGEERVASLEKAVKKSELAHVTVITGDPNGTKFPEGCCDAIFMRNVYHHFADPAAMNASILRSLKPGGRLAVVDFTPPKEAEQPADRGKDGMHGVTPDSVARELKAVGFTIVDTVVGKDRWFMVVAAKPGSQPADQESHRSIPLAAANAINATAPALK